MQQHQQQLLWNIVVLVLVVAARSAEGVEEQVLSIVHSRNLEKNVVIISFLEDALKEVRELNKAIATGLIYAKHSNPIKAALELKANYLIALYRFTHTATVQKAHENGLENHRLDHKRS